MTHSPLSPEERESLEDHQRYLRGLGAELPADLPPDLGEGGRQEPAPQRVPRLRPVPRHEQFRGQLRFAQRFAHVYGEEFLHVHGLGWHQWDGARWAACQDGAETRAVVELVKHAWSEMPLLEGAERKALLQDVGKVESASGVTGVLKLAGDLKPCALAASRLDQDPALLNTLDGAVQLETGVRTDSDPADYLSKVTRAGFDPQARAAEFDRFLEQAQPDPQMRAFLARSLGSALLGQVREHVLLIWFGKGANGKGTLRDAVAHALGDYAIEVPADLLLQSRHSGAMSSEKMRLKGARVAFCSEIAEGDRLDEATMKKLTGGDPINARLLYRNPVEFDPSHTLVMLTNHLPRVRGDDPAIWRRILAVPFDNIVPPNRRDARLPEKLKGCPDAVLAWLWAGWCDYQRQGLNPPQAVLDATSRYQLDSDTIARFLADDATICDGHGQVGSADLYRTFVDWCRGQGEPTDLTQKSFTEALDARGYPRKRGARGIVWHGLSLVPDEVP